jgi:hypothetical protein
MRPNQNLLTTTGEAKALANSIPYVCPPMAKSPGGDSRDCPIGGEERGRDCQTSVI